MTVVRAVLGRPTTKSLTKLAVVAVVAMVAVVGAGIVARSFSGITQSEETNEVFNAAATPPSELLDSVVWEADPVGLKRQVEPLTRADVTSSWLRAWEQLSVVAQTGDTTGLEVYFANSALEALLASTDDRLGLPVHQLGHTLRVDFYSQDGQVIGLAADRVNLIRSTEIGGVAGWKETVESYDAVLLLEDGNWRIQHWVRRDAEEHWWTTPAEPSVEKFATSERHEVGTPLGVNGINYLPQGTPVAEMWIDYDPEVVAADLDRIVDAGLDSVRVSLPFEELGGAAITEFELAPVEDFLDLANERGLGVVVTLFDGWHDHRPSKWNSDSRYIETVAGTLGPHPALILWDLKDEPDKDIGRFGVEEQLTYAWLGHIARSLRSADPVTPSTVGWSNPEAALVAPIHTDVVSFHFYEDPDLLPVYGEALRAHAEARPVLMTEFGSPTWNSIFPGGRTEADQASYTADVLTNARVAKLDGTMAWTLWDLANAPADAGIAPWSAGPATTYGVLRADGSAKPALAVIDPTVDLNAIDRVGVFGFLGLTAWRMVVIVLFVGTAFFWFARLVGNPVRSRRDAEERRGQ